MINKYILFIAILCSIVFSANMALAQVSLNITSPIHLSNLTQSSNLALNYDVTGTNSNYNYSCWYSLNSGNNISLPGCTNLIGLNAIEGGNIWRIWVNESAGASSNITYSSVQFYVDSTAPVINFIFPISGRYYNNASMGLTNNNILNNLSYTLAELNPNLGASGCWFNNGTKDTNFTCGSSISISSYASSLSATVGSNTWYIYPRDLFNNTGSASVTFHYDPVFPILNNIWNTSTSDSIKINYQVNEDVQVSIRYGNSTDNLNMTLNNTDYDDSDYVEFEDLIENRIYFYNITICDHAFNCVRYGTFNFTVNYTITAPIVNYSCYTDAVCGAWSACSAVGLQTRICNKININCAYATSPITTQTCNYSLTDLTANPLVTMAPENNITNTTKKSWGGISDNTKYALIIISIIIIIGIGIALYLRFKNPEYNDIPQNSTDADALPGQRQYSNYNADDLLGDNA